MRIPIRWFWSTDTGFEDDYSADYYARYRDSSNLMFPVSQQEDRIHPKSVVFGFNIEGGAVAYTEALLQENMEYRHDFNGVEHVVILHDDGIVTLQRGDETFEPIRLFWFAWYTFNPQTELIR